MSPAENDRVLARAIAEFIAMGYLRHRKTLAREMAKESALRPEKPLDDVAPEGMVVPTENRTPEKEGSQ